ncbi:hypothetical protein RA8CHR_03211 [Variovorax sp. RA8]|nr:hypothetical protein RA8CHR_03211 [Variovorax sp. RA8]
MNLIIGCTIPCTLEIRLTEQNVEQFNEIMEYCGDAFSKLDLRLSKDLSVDSASLIINSVANLKDVKKLSLTFEEYFDLDFSETDMGLDLSGYLVNADSVILRGAGEKNSFIKVLLKMMQPSSLSLDLITPSVAADLLASFMEKEEKMDFLNELHICCSISDDEPQEFLLLEAIKNSIKLRPGLNIVVQSNFSLFSGEKDKTEFIQATQNNPVENIRLESYLPAIDGWQSYLQINPSLHAKAQEYFGLMGLPKELGTEAVNGGSFKPADILTLNAANAIFTKLAEKGLKPQLDPNPPKN